MSFVGPMLAVGGNALQGFAEIRQGQAAGVMGEARQQELDREAKLAEIAAKESQADRLDELQRTAGTVKALIAARGLDPSSPSYAAISGANQRIVDTNIQRERFNTTQQASNLRLAGKAARMSGNAARTAGYLRGAGSFFKAASGAASMFAGGA